MPLDDARYLLFVHVPKNAGTALVDRLRMRAQGHRSWRAYAADYPREWASYTAFAAVRAPLDRFLSNVAYERMERAHWHARSGDAKHGKHPDFELCTRCSALEIAHVLAENPRALRHPGGLSKWPWIDDDDGRVRGGHVLRHERLDQDLRELGIDEALPRVNVSERAREEPVTAELAALVRRVYARDCALFFPGDANGAKIPDPAPMPEPASMPVSVSMPASPPVSVSLTAPAEPRTFAKLETRLAERAFPRRANPVCLDLDALGAITGSSTSCTPQARSSIRRAPSACSSSSARSRAATWRSGPRPCPSASRTKRVRSTARTVLRSRDGRRFEVGRRPRAVARGARRGGRSVLGARHAGRALRRFPRARADRLEPAAPQ